MERPDLRRQAAGASVRARGGRRPGAWPAAIGLWLVGAGVAAATPGAAPTPALLEAAAASDEAMRRLIDPSQGLVVIEHFEGGDAKRAQHLCGEELQRALPDIRAGLGDDRKNWTTATALICRSDECYYDPGETGRHDGRYIFRRVRGDRLALRAIVRLESGALDTTKQERYAAEALRKWRKARCPR